MDQPITNIQEIDDSVYNSTDPDIDREKDHESTEVIDLNPKDRSDYEEKEKDESVKGEDKEDEEKRDTEKPLLEDDSVKIHIKDDEGEDTPTLPLPDKKKKSKNESGKGNETTKGSLPKYLFPITRLKNTWNNSKSIWQFLLNAIYIIFSTIGWFTCVGGVPFISLAMLIVGSVFVNDCRRKPNIPVYLIVAGLLGTIQHFITIWIKYVPKSSEGRLPVYRSYCRSINGIFHLFLIIWFILGCVWVYSIHNEVDFRDPEKEEYCHKTVYYFAFWILNLSFILLSLLFVLSCCFIISIITSNQTEEVVGQ